MLPNDRLIYCNVLAAQNLEKLGRSTAAAGRCSDSSGNIPHTTVVTVHSSIQNSQILQPSSASRDSKTDHSLLAQEVRCCTSTSLYKQDM